MNLKIIALALAYILLFTACLKVPSNTINKAQKTDFAEISRQLLDMEQHHSVDSVIFPEKLTDINLKKSLKDLDIARIDIVNKSYNEQVIDSVIVYQQFNKNISIRLYRWEKGTSIIYDYAKRERDLAEKKDEFSTATKKIKDRLYIYRYKEPSYR